MFIQLKNKMRNQTEIKAELKKLNDYSVLIFDQKVRDLIASIIEENQPRIKELEKELAECLAAKKPEKPRFPEGVPEAVFKVCEDYWKGSEEHSIYRIHSWNDKCVWTSYPAHAWYCQGVRHQGKASFYLLSLKELEHGLPKVVRIEDGRFSEKEMKIILDM